LRLQCLGVQHSCSQLLRIHLLYSFNPTIFDLKAPSLTEPQPWQEDSPQITVSRKALTSTSRSTNTPRRRSPRDPLHRNSATNPRCLQTVRLPFPFSLPSYARDHTNTSPSSAALKHHPDRVPSDSPERASKTRKFQQINDAYYTLSDPTRRRDYDQARTYHGFSSGAGSGAGTYPGGFPEEYAEGATAGDTDGGAGTSGGAGWGSSFPFSAFGFGGKKDEGEGSGTGTGARPHEDAQFASVFEEMLREEGMAEDGGRPTSKFWSVIGGLSGGAMGFIVANFPGMLAGAVAGNRLGAVRDAKGKSVYEVFQQMPQNDKARLLSQLAAKVFSHAVGVGSGI
jgi:hypothetical protein